MTLSLGEQAIFEQYLLVELRIIVVDITLTYAQKIAKCGRKMRKFCAFYKSIGDKMKFVKISDFGFAYDFAFAVIFLSKLLIDLITFLNKII